MFGIQKTNLRVRYLYVQINIDEDPRVVYVMHVCDNQLKMKRLIPKYRYELLKKTKLFYVINENFTIITEDC